MVVGDIGGSGGGSGGGGGDVGRDREDCAKLSAIATSVAAVVAARDICAREFSERINSGFDFESARRD